MRRAPFVGRRDEVAQVREALSSARQGSGSVVLLGGDAGIGKTSLAQEITRAAAWLGTPAVWGPAIEAEGTPPYWCWRQALTGLSRTVEGVQLPDFSQLDSGSSQFVFFEAVVAALHEGAVPNGLLVVLDDLHWADSGSLRLLQVAAAQAPTTHVLILGTYRPPSPGDSSPFAQILPALLRERAVSRIVLSGLDSAETESLLSQTLDRPVGGSLARRLHEQTDGNPFYLIELAELVRAGGPTQLPHTLGDVARQRLALISESGRRILGPAAVIGRDFELRLLAAAIGAHPATVFDQLAEATAAGVVEEIRPGQHRFTHALLREALYLELSPTEQAAAHASVAVSIAGLGAGARAAHIDALAHHLRQALPLSDAAEALAATIEAAEAAEAKLAFQQAAERYAEAIDLSAEANVPGHSRSGLLLRLARCQYRAGAVAAAWQASERTAAAARDEGDAQALAAAALVMGGLVDQAIAQPLLSICQEALRELAGADPILEARLLGQMAIASWSRERRSEPAMADRALDAARRTGDPEARFLALQAKELELARQPERAQERLKLSEEAVQIASEAQDPRIAVWARSWRLGASWEFGLRGPADSELAALATAVDRTKEPLARWRLETARATLALIDGRYSDAVEAGERAFVIGRRGGYEEGAWFARVFHHMAAARTGETAAEDELRELSKGLLRLWYPSYLADQGRIAELRDLWPAIAAAAAGPLPSNLMFMVWKAKLATALADRAWAAQLYEPVRPFSHLHLTRGFFGGYEGPLALYAGQLAALLDRREEAEDLIRRALEAATAIGSPPFEALARHQLARLLRGGGRARDRILAVSHLEQAGATAERLGMRPLARVVATELQALRHPHGRTSRLTHREEEVAGLVAQGLTNRALGERLHISERTAENHVKNILDKLGLDSRAQIAAWSVAQATGEASPSKRLRF